MSQVKYQRYKITITREENNQWRVNGYWEVPAYQHSPEGKRIWDLDGAPRLFNSRREALDFIANQTGVPE